MRGRSILAPALLSLLLAPGTARADEIRLKDGTKITGTIVGFENDSFRVETSYGFALVRKDKVADITVSTSKPESKPEARPELKPEVKPEIRPEAKKEPEPKTKSGAAPAPSSTA